MPDSPETPRFDAFAIDPRIGEAVAALGFDRPTPIQAQAIPPLLEGRDVIGRARTGSGKTAAFGIPLLSRLADGGDKVRALLLAPTRELALQVTEALRTYAKQLPVRIVTLYGGAPYGPQLRALKSGVSIVVGTPGRVLDHLDRGSLDLSSVETLILDEADEMLRMGFFDDVERVLDALPTERQVVLFSATMPEPIQRIAKRRMKDPLEIQVEESALTVTHIDQRYLMVTDRFKIDALVRVLATEPRGATLVFARTRAGCAEVADELAGRGLAVDALHGDLNQAARERVLSRLRSKQLSVVVATDVAARGIDVEHLTLVVNMDLPNDPEQYVHRIGRTGRAGRAGAAIAFITPREEGKLRTLQRILNVRIQLMDVPSDADIARCKVEQLARDLAAVERGEPTGEEAPPLTAVADQLLEGREPRELLEAALLLLADERGLDLRVPADPRPPSWGRRQVAFKPERRPRERGERPPRDSDARHPGPRDSGPRDFVPRDSGPRDSGPRPPRDAGPRDAGPRDAGPRDAGPRDAGPRDAGPRDARDAGPRDTGPHDERFRDAPRMNDAEAVALFLPVGKLRGVRAGDVVGSIANDVGIPGHQIGRITILDHKTFIEVPKDVADAVLENRRDIELRGQRVPITLARPRLTAPGARAPRRAGPPGPRPKKPGPVGPQKRWQRKK